MRLWFFDLVYGNRIGGRYIIDQMGIKDGLYIIAKSKLRLSYRNPFMFINKQNKPTANQKLSQQQMAPMIVLYDLLKEQGYDQQEAIEFLKGLGIEVATAFLNYNVPLIQKKDWAHKSLTVKNNQLKKIVSRFFNAEANAKVEEGDKFIMDVNFCHFAHYCRQLGYPELGPIFCAADRHFFETVQHDVKFERTQTLVKDGKPCDFRFEWKEDAHG